MKTEFYELDKLVNMNKPQLIVLGARPGMGKSTFSLNIATNIALHQDIPVLFFSLEENYLRSDMKELNYCELTKKIKDVPFHCLADKIIASEEMIRRDDLKKIRSPYLYFEDKSDMKEEEFNQRLNSGIKKLKKSKLFIKDKAPLTIDEIISDIEEYVKNESVKLVIIDYLQLIQYDKSKLLSRDNEIADIMKKLKEISNKLKISIFITTQLSRGPEYRDDHRPILEDVRENEHIVEIADVIMLLYRDDYYYHDTEMKNLTELHVSKNNNGNVGIINLIYLCEYFKLANLEKGYCEDKNIINCEMKEKIMRNQINEIYESNSNKFFIEPWMIEANKVIDIILQFFEDKNIKCDIDKCFEDNIINRMLNNDIEEYINTFKESEYVIFAFNYFEMNTNLQNFIYDTSKKILNNGVTKKIIYVSETLGLNGFSKHIYEELNKNAYIFKK